MSNSTSLDLPVRSRSSEPASTLTLKSEVLSVLDDITMDLRTITKKIYALRSVSSRIDPRTNHPHLDKEVENVLQLNTKLFKPYSSDGQTRWGRISRIRIKPVIIVPKPLIKESSVSTFEKKAPKKTLKAHQAVVNKKRGRPRLSAEEKSRRQSQLKADKKVRVEKQKRDQLSALQSILMQGDVIQGSTLTEIKALLTDGCLFFEVKGKISSLKKILKGDGFIQTGKRPLRWRASYQKLEYPRVDDPVLPDIIKAVTQYLQQSLNNPSRLGVPIEIIMVETKKMAPYWKIEGLQITENIFNRAADGIISKSLEKDRTISKEPIDTYYVP